MADIRVFYSDTMWIFQLLTTLKSGIKSKALFDSDYLEEVRVTGERTLFLHTLFTSKLTEILPCKIVAKDTLSYECVSPQL